MLHKSVKLKKFFLHQVKNAAAYTHIINYRNSKVLFFFFFSSRMQIYGAYIIAHDMQHSALYSLNSIFFIAYGGGEEAKILWHFENLYKLHSENRQMQRPH
jgi:hypothetical protein